MAWKKGSTKYTRRFRPDFIGMLHGQADRFASIWDHLHEQDSGATDEDGNMIPHHGAASSNLRAESELAYTARSKKLYSLIWTHVEDIN